MASYARQIPWPTGAALDRVKTQISWNTYASSKTVLGAAASAVAVLVLISFLYNAIVPKNHLLVSEPTCEDRYDQVG